MGIFMPEDTQKRCEAQPALLQVRALLYFFFPISTSSLVKSHQSNRSRPRDYFASPDLFVEIINSVLFWLKPAVAELSKGSPRPTASTGDG